MILKTRKWLLACFVCLILIDCTPEKVKKDVSPGYEIAAYYFPNYHPNDPRNQALKGEGWSEWELVKNARPRFPGHHQPNVPLWGYTDESDTNEMARKIKTAADYGIDAFIFDWYYYDDGLFLQNALEKGFLGASNNNRIKFALMWANHDWIDIHPVTYEDRIKGPKLLYPGKISLKTWDRMTDYIIETYFKHPSYWKIENAPYFSVYDLTRFLDIFGSVEGAKQGMLTFREKVKAAGFDDLHLNAVVWGRTILPSEEPVENTIELVQELGFDSFTSYVWIHHVHLEQFPQTPYDYVRDNYFKYAETATKSASLPYFPNVTMGWDSSPRAHQDDPFENIGYPFMASMSQNTPEAFKDALIQMRDFLDKHPENKHIFNINCWNEWTEGSYLEPDTTHGLAYLQAIKEVFAE